jgi:hypothetical protein
MWTYIKSNWKTNLAALAAFAYSVPQFVSAITAWQAGQHPDWRGAIISLVMAAGLAAAKDGTNHSTMAQVQASTAAVTVSKAVTAGTP